MTQTFMEQLRDSTLTLHNSAEGSQFQGSLAHGTLPQPAYVYYLGQIFLIHQALESEIKRLRNGSSALASVVTDAQLQEDFLRQDLQKFSVNPDTLEPSAHVKKLIATIKELAGRFPESLLGFHYVLLGSKHGGKLVAKNVRSSYELGDGAGAIYFDPYGSTFMELWKEFKESMNRLELSEQAKLAIFEAAKAMFSGVNELSEAEGSSL